MDLKSVRRAYRFYAPIYDWIFNGFVQEGRREAVKALPRADGSRILEVGVGTGLSLPIYATGVHVTGIDISHEMLERARRRFQNEQYPHVGELLEMDAQKLDFESDSFDGVAVMYVASVVPDAAAMMAEVFRVAKPGAPVTVVNHFASEKGVLKRVEKGFAPFSRRLGFRPDFDLTGFVECSPCAPKRVTPVNAGGYWRLVEFVTPEQVSSESNSPRESVSKSENDSVSQQEEPSFVRSGSTSG